MVRMCDNDEYSGWKESEWSSRQTGVAICCVHVYVCEMCTTVDGLILKD